MHEIEVFRKEIPPIKVADLAEELEVLAALVDRWLHCTGREDCEAVHREVIARLSPNLMKTLVMIAQKQTAGILDKRRRTTLTYLGRVHVHGVLRRDCLQWVDVLLTDDATPLLRRVAVSPAGLGLHAATWAGCASLHCAHTDRWDKERKIWRWDTAGGETATVRLREQALPRIPLRMNRGDTLAVPDWHRHLEYTALAALLHALDQFGEGGLHDEERAAIVDLLKEAGADLNPLWTHLLREGEWE